MRSLKSKITFRKRSNIRITQLGLPTKMKTQRMLRIIVGLVATALAHSTCAGADRVGYIDCLPSARSSSVLTFEHPCIKEPVGEISCGQKVEVTHVQGAWLEFKMPDGMQRFIGTASVSKDPHSFVPFDSNPTVVPAMNLAECNAVRARHSVNQPAEVLSAPEPEYTISAWQAEVEGVVGVSVLIGVDGRAYDVRVQKPLGWGLDERTVLAVQKWRFAPALKNGKPIPSRMDIDVPLRLTCFSTGSIRTRTCEPTPTAGSTVDSDVAKGRRRAP